MVKHMHLDHFLVAIKSNPDPVVLKLLGKSGLGFDCASDEEIEAVLRIDVPPEKIIFAHPTKRISHLELAKRHSVSMMTFDCESELRKIKDIYPEAELVIRMLVDSSKSEFPVSYDICSIHKVVMVASHYGSKSL